MVLKDRIAGTRNRWMDWRYRRTFGRAARLSASLGYAAGAGPIRLGDGTAKVLNDSLRALLTNYLMGMPVALQCLPVCADLAERIEQQIGIAAWPTVGQLWYNGRSVYAPTEKDVRQWLDCGFGPEDQDEDGGLRLHAWITLETGHILEPTLPHSISAVSELQVFADQLCWVAPFGEVYGHRFVPIAVGHAVAQALLRGGPVAFVL